MPTYRYRCAKCSDELEVWQSFEEKPKSRHNGGCGGKLAKVMSPAGIVLKGSGFYKTDNRSSPKSGATAGRDKDSGSSSSSETKSDSNSSDSKKETKSDSKATSSPTKTETSAKT